MLSQESLNTVTQQVMSSVDSMIAPVFVGTKVLALAFILINWGKKLLEGMDRAKEEGKNFSLKPTDIVYGMLYILLVVNINVVTEGMEDLLASYAGSFQVENSQRLYNFWKNCF